MIEVKESFIPCTNIFDRIKKYNLPLGEYAVFGSSLLDVLGIRPAADLDIIVTPELFDQLKNQGWEHEKWEGIELLHNGEAEISTVQTVPTTGSYLPDRIQLIKDAIIIEGCPFVRIEEVVACKTDYNREKDRVDIASIKNRLSENPDIFS
jgi:hypothetical protein